MKTPVTITLIICGTILILAPIIDSMVVITQVAETMEELKKDVNLNSNLPDYYDNACMIIGLLMIAVGIVVPLKSKNIQ